MDELINLVSQRTGIPADKAQVAVQTIIDHLKQYLPAPIASQLDSFVAGGGSGNMLGDLGGMMKNVEGMFGSK